jgi:flagellar M-ring protein FliF
MTMGDGGRSSAASDGVWRPGGEDEPKGLKDRVARMASGYSTKQKVIAGVAVVGVVLGVFLVSRMTGGTKWAPLYTDLKAEDGGAIVAELEERGIPHQLAAGGTTIMVPAETVYDTRLAMSDTQLPSDGKVGYGVLDSQGLATSEFGQRVGYQRAMEGELATTIEALDPVETAVVHLALPADEVFAVDDAQASASVLVRTRPGQALSDDQVRAVTNLVASSIEGLSPEAVTVADADGNVLAAPGQEISGTGGGGQRQKQTTEFERAMQASLDEMLYSVVGADKSKVNVSAVLDFDETNTSRETFEAPAAGPAGNDLVLEESTRDETYTGAAAQAQGVLGPDTPAAAVGGDSEYSLDEADVRFAVNRVVESTNTAPGAIERLSVAVLLDEDKLTAQQAQDLTGTLSAAAGINPERGDVLTVTRMPFDESAAAAVDAELEAAEKAEAAAERRAFLQNVMLVAFLALLMIVAFVSYRVAARRRARGAMELVAGDDPPPALPPADLAAMVDDAEDADVLELSAVDEGELGELVEDGEHELVLASVAAEQAAVMADELERMQRDAHLTDLIDNQPDEVASLLRGWLGDRRGVSR